MVIQSAALNTTTAMTTITTTRQKEMNSITLIRLITNTIVTLCDFLFSCREFYQVNHTKLGVNPRQTLIFLFSTPSKCSSSNFSFMIVKEHHYRTKSYFISFGLFIDPEGTLDRYLLDFKLTWKYLTLSCSILYVITFHFKQCL